MVALLIKSEKEHLMKLTSLNLRVGKIKMNPQPTFPARDCLLCPVWYYFNIIFWPEIILLILLYWQRYSSIASFLRFYWSRLCLSQKKAKKIILIISAFFKFVAAQSRILDCKGWVLDSRGSCFDFSEPDFKGTTSKLFWFIFSMNFSAYACKI